MAPLRLASGLGVSADGRTRTATTPRVANGRNRARRRRRKSDGRKNESEGGGKDGGEEEEEEYGRGRSGAVDLRLQSEAQEKLNGEETRNDGER